MPGCWHQSAHDVNGSTTLNDLAGFLEASFGNIGLSNLLQGRI